MVSSECSATFGAMKRVKHIRGHGKVRMSNVVPGHHKNLKSTMKGNGRLLMARSAAVAKRCASHTEWNISSVQCVGPLKIVAVADVVVRSEETASAARMKLMFGKQTVSGLTYGICAGHVSLGSRVTRLQCKGFPAFY